MKRQSELKPCPFCGGKAITDGGNNRWSVECKNCHASVYWFEFTIKGRKKAIKAWNKRTLLKGME